MAVAWVFGLWVAPRLIVGALPENTWTKLGSRAWTVLTAAKAALIVLAIAGVLLQLVPGPAELVLGVAAVLGFASALTGEARRAAVSRAVPIDRLGQGTAGLSFADRVAVLVAGTAAGVLSYLLPVALALGIAAAAFVGAAGAAYLALTRVSRVNGHAVDQRQGERRAVTRQAAVWLAAALTTGAVGATLLIAAFTFTVRVPVGPDSFRLESAGAFLVAAAGLGMVLGPLALPRLLLRLPAALILIGLALVLAVGVIGLAVVPSFLLALVVLAVFGFVSVSMDRLRSIALRRVASADAAQRFGRLSVLVLTVGQLLGAVIVVITGGRDPLWVAAALAVAQVLLLAPPRWRAVARSPSGA